MGELGDIFFPKLDEDKDMIPFDQIAFDLLQALGLTPDICQSEDEAKQKALLLQELSLRATAGSVATSSQTDCFVPTNDSFCKLLNL